MDLEEYLGIEGEDYVRVKPGDTLESIAKEQLGSETLVPLLKQINDIPPTGIRDGMVIFIRPPWLESG